MMFHLRRIVALTCALFIVSTGCAQYQGAGARYEPSVADRRLAMTAAEPAFREGNDGMVEQVVAVSAGDSDMWSGGEVDTLSAGSFKPDGAVLAKSAAPPPPPPGPATGSVSIQAQSPAKEAPAGKKGEQTAPTSTPANPTPSEKKPESTEGVAVIRAPMLIYTGRIHMAVYEVKNSLAEVESLAKVLGGFLAKRDDRTITIRIPASRFDEAMRRIEKLGDMLSRDVQVEDVTEEFNDVDIRLKNARAVRDRLEQLLSKAAKVEESIQIERELERVALQIERLEGRMKFLRDRATFSTITVMFDPRSAAELGKRPFNLPVPWLYEMGLGRLLAL